MTPSEYAARYAALGWHLVPIPAGSKAPQILGWQRPEKSLKGQAAATYWERNPTHNMGLLHEPSGTCALDIDHVENTRLIFEDFGIDYKAIMASAPRIVGRLDRGKLLFRAVPGLTTRKLSWPSRDDPRKTEVVFELRAGAVQDVLPPSIHPDTGNPYRWQGPPPWNGLPEIPAPLLTLWTEWDKFRTQLQDMCPWKPTREFQPPRKKRPPGERTSVIDAFNAAHDMHELLVRYGYKPTRRGRYLSPNSKSGLAGVVLFDDGRAYSHHASDPFDHAHTFDAFDLFCHYEHGGDVAKAVKAAALFLNLTTDPQHEYNPDSDPEILAHGKKVWDTIRTKPQLPAVAPPAFQHVALDGIPPHLLTVPGTLAEAVNYYNATAPKPQPQFAVQAALAFGSVVMGRRWVTDQNNMTSLYFVNVAKSAAGKEHVKTVLERLLEDAGLATRIGPSGYTSASGVFSALVDQPCHVSIIDELGRVLESSQASGNHHKQDAQTIIMEVFGRQTSTLRPQGYSKMGLTAKQAKEFEKVVRSPSLTIMAMTTPSTLYGGISSRYVADGFLGRFLIVESHIGRQPSGTVKRIDPPAALREWAEAHGTAALGDIPCDLHDVAPAAIEVPFAPECHQMLRACDADMIGLMDEYEKHGLEAMFGRTKEIAQRLALIVARSKCESTISADSLQWAIDYATFYALRTVNALKRSLSDGPFEAACKAVLAKVEAAGLRGITERDLARAVRAFANLEPRKRREVLEALAADHGLKCRQDKTKGRPRIVWFKPADDEDEGDE
jgi:hypothetical protein